MNANTALQPANTARRSFYADGLLATAITGVYRALAIAEAQWAEAREQALLDGLGTDDDDDDGEVYLSGALPDVQ